MDLSSRRDAVVTGLPGVAHAPMTSMHGRRGNGRRRRSHLHAYAEQPGRQSCQHDHLETQIQV